MRTRVEIKIKNIDEVTKAIQSRQIAATKALQATAADMQRRIPSIVATEVSAIYNIKKSEIIPGKKSAGKKENKKSKAAKAYITGETVSELKVVYVGRNLSLLHFGMKPGKRPLSPKDENGKVKRNKKGVAKKAKPYVISAEVIRGRRHSYEGNSFLAKTGKFSADGEKPAPYIAFVRIGKKRKPIKAIKRWSVPGMIHTRRISKKIDEGIAELLRKRLSHNMKRFGFKK